MELRPLGASGVKVSVLSLGTMNFGADWHDIGPLGEREARDLVDIALDAGVNLIDTADIYGRGASEEMLGRILAGRRSKVLIASKVLGQMRPDDPASGGLGRRHVVEGCEDSLRRLRTDVIDLYMPHGWDPRVPLEESLEAFSRLVRDGKVRVLGCSNFSGQHLQQSLAAGRDGGWPRMEFDQVQYSLAERGAEAELAPVCVASGVSVLAWSPLGGGWLTGKYRRGRPRPEGARRSEPGRAFPLLPEGRLEDLNELLARVAELEGASPAQAALRWLLARPWVSSAVIGARTGDQLKDSLGAAPRALSARGLALLDRASALVHAAAQ